METHLRCRKRPAKVESYTRAAPGEGAMEPPDERNAIEYGQLQSRLSVARTCVVAIEWSRSQLRS